MPLRKEVVLDPEEFAPGFHKRRFLRCGKGGRGYYGVVEYVLEVTEEDGEMDYVDVERCAAVLTAMHCSNSAHLVPASCENVRKGCSEGHVALRRFHVTIGRRTVVSAGIVLDSHCLCEGLVYTTAVNSRIE